MRCFIFLLSLFILNACQIKPEELNISSDGVWKQLGYGKILEIKGDTIKEYDICKVGCNLYEEGLLADIGKIDFFNKYSLTLRKNIKTYKYIRLNKLPEICLKNVNNPMHDFEVLWNTFNEQYCYFEERNVNWNEAYKTYKPQIKDKTTELELYVIMNKMLSSLNDGHVSLDVPRKIKEASRALQLKDEKEQTKSKEEIIDPYYLGVQAQNNIAEKYCEEYKIHNGGIAKWGMMKNKMAYVQINAMFFLAFYDLPKDLTLEQLAPYYQEIGNKRTYQRQDEIDGADQLMEMILTDLKDANALILDLRFNIGGKDEAALAITGSFIENEIKIATKKAKLENDFTNHQNIFLSPNKPSFLKNVYILTSHETASAAELAVMSTLKNKRVKRIGSNTEGIFSDGLDKRLPNGWEYTLSNEVYQDLDGNNYEGKGISPHIDLNYPKDKRAFFNLLLQQISSGKDEAIEKAISLENEK